MAIGVAGGRGNGIILGGNRKLVRVPLGRYRRNGVVGHRISGDAGRLVLVSGAAL